MRFFLILLISFGPCYLTESSSNDPGEKKTIIIRRKLKKNDMEGLGLLLNIKRGGYFESLLIRVTVWASK